MCALCGLAGIASGGLNCEDLSRDPGLGIGESAPGAESAGPGAPPAFSLTQIIQQLRTQWGDSFEGATMSWSGAGAISYYIGGTPYSSGSGEIAYWTSMTALMISRATLAFELWDDLIARNLNPASSPASAQIQFEYATRTYNSNGVLATNGGTYSSGWFNSTSTNSYGTTNYNLSRGEIWLNSNWTSHNADNDMYFGGYGFQTYMHEIGHSLGLSHPGTYDAGNGGSITYTNSAEYSLDNRQYTIMSYFGGYAPGSGWQQDGTQSNWLYSSTPMLHDVAAIQAIYGADTTTRTSDTTYGFHSNAGRDVFDFTIDTTPIVTVWDAGGNDTIDLSGYSANQQLDLNAGTYSNIGGMLGNFAIAYNVVIENAIGGTGGDALYGNDANNSLRGGPGNDAIDGRAGFDTAVFSGLRSAYTLTNLGGDSVRVSGPDGTDTLSNIEQLRFDDQTIPWLLFSDLTAGLTLSGNTASITTSNLGGSAGVSTTALYLSTDSTVTTADTVLTTFGVPAIGSLSSASVTAALAFPGNLTPGTYFLGAIADINGQVTEENESNNLWNVVAVILGNSSANTLNGSSANDTMFSLGGSDRLNGAAGADMLTGGTGADIFVFDATALANAAAGVFDRVTDYNQSGGSFSAAEGDQIDLSGILSAAYNHGNGQPVSSLVRIVVSGPGTKLQVDTDGAANGANWVTIAQLDGLHINDTGNVILDASLPGGSAIAVIGSASVKSFDGDARSDILWQNDGGALGIWLMDGVNVATYSPAIPHPGAGWHAKDAGDFNGDGKADVLWQHDNGTPAVWLMDGINPIAFGPLLHNSGPAWHTIAAADFNADGKADILWQHDGGAIGVWLMDGVNVASSSGAIPHPGAGWHAKEAADFNGDGKADILWQHDNGAPAVWLMDGINPVAFGPVLFNSGPAWHEVAAADFNGDGKADILWQHDGGAIGVWLMDGVNVATPSGAIPHPGAGWHVKGAVDTNGDGKADILWQHDNGTPAVWLMDGMDLFSAGPVLSNPGASWHVI
jgi:Ca2+-binding RTX toxin-like protein